MTKPKHGENRPGLGPRTFLVPVLWIVVLVASYWVLADWQSLPSLITTTLAAI